MITHTPFYKAHWETLDQQGLLKPLITSFQFPVRLSIIFNMFFINFTQLSKVQHFVGNVFPQTHPWS